MTEHQRPLYRGRAGLSEREYAAHSGISRGAVQKARASGRLVLHTESVPVTDWNRCEQVLNRADMVEYLKRAWLKR